MYDRGPKKSATGGLTKAALGVARTTWLETQASIDEDDGYGSFASVRLRRWT
jgi:hypothetical protein